MAVSFTRHQDSLQQMSVQGAKFTKFGLGLLEESINFSQHCHVYIFSPTSWLISTRKDKKYVVDLVKSPTPVVVFRRTLFHVVTLSL
jgi:hypothetical protein